MSEKGEDLIKSSEYGDLSAIKSICESSPELINYQGIWMENTPLMYACKNGHFDVVKHLLQTGADSNLFNKDGWTPLMEAAQNRHHNIILLFIEKGLNIDHQDNDGETALIIASMNGHLNIVQSLIDHKANKNCMDNWGQDALHWAARRGHYSVVQYLVDQGADVTRHNNEGQLAMDVICHGTKDKLNTTSIFTLLKNAWNATMAKRVEAIQKAKQIEHVQPPNREFQQTRANPSNPKIIFHMKTIQEDILEKGISVDILILYKKVINLLHSLIRSKIKVQLKQAIHDENIHLKKSLIQQLEEYPFKMDHPMHESNLSSPSHHHHHDHPKVEEVQIFWEELMRDVIKYGNYLFDELEEFEMYEKNLETQRELQQLALKAGLQVQTIVHFDSK